MNDSAPILEINNLEKRFEIKRKSIFEERKFFKAVNNVSFSIRKQEVFGLVGESGSGKTTLGRSVMRLYKPEDGSIKFNGQETRDLKHKELKKFRAECQMIFQDSYASINPMKRIHNVISEPLKAYGYGSTEINERVLWLINKVGLDKSFLERFSHQFSGGQRQRIGIARALSLNPKLIICDEPVASLDVSIQAQVVNLLKELQKSLGLTYLFIAHDLDMVQYISDRIGVMYKGSLMEIGSSEQVNNSPCHPYTQALISAVPKPDPHIEKNKKEIKLKPSDNQNSNFIVDGCPLADRCPKVQSKCFEEKPELKQLVGYEDHYCACFYPDIKG